MLTVCVFASVVFILIKSSAAADFLRHSLRFTKPLRRTNSASGFVECTCGNRILTSYFSASFRQSRDFSVLCRSDKASPNIHDVFRESGETGDLNMTRCVSLLQDIFFSSLVFVHLQAAESFNRVLSSGTNARRRRLNHSGPAGRLARRTGRGYTERRDAAQRKPLW